MRIYYLNAEYEAGKHKIAAVWSDKAFQPEPIINEPYSNIVIDEEYNPIAFDIASQATVGKYYVDNTGDIWEVEGWEPDAP